MTSFSADPEDLYTLEEASYTQERMCFSLTVSMLHGAHVTTSKYVEL